MGVFAHGFTLGKDSPAAARICKGLAAEGIGMLRFDNLGLGDSDGDWGDGSFTNKVSDTVRAAEFMADRGTRVDLLVGHRLRRRGRHRSGWTGPATEGGSHDRGARRAASCRAQLRRARRPRAGRGQG